MNHEQLKYLKKRLSELERKKLDWNYQKVPIPRPVAAAKRVVDAWAAKQRKAAEDRRTRIGKAYSKAYQTILFGEPDAALTALEQFEKFQP